jgi:hypothetical protein
LARTAADDRGGHALALALFGSFSLSEPDSGVILAPADAGLGSAVVTDRDFLHACVVLNVENGFATGYALLLSFWRLPPAPVAPDPAQVLGKRSDTGSSAASQQGRSRRRNAAGARADRRAAADHPRGRRGAGVRDRLGSRRFGPHCRVHGSALFGLLARDDVDPMMRFTERPARCLLVTFLIFGRCCSAGPST